jgi:hypothetical protein
MKGGLATCRAIAHQARDAVRLAASGDGQRLQPGGRSGRAWRFCLVESGNGASVI